MSNLFDPSAQVDAFYAAYKSGELGSLEYGAAVSRDAHDLFRLFCDRRQEPACNLATFVSLLVSRHPVYLVRKRYIDGGARVGPHGVLILAPFKNPPPGDELTDYGRRISDFRAVVRIMIAAAANAR